MAKPDPDEVPFARDTSPHDVIVEDHIIYLHVNGELILKRTAYEFSPSCMVRDGGFVVMIWLPPRSLINIRDQLTTWKSLRRYVNRRTWESWQRIGQSFSGLH